MDPLRAQQLAAELEVEMMADMYNRLANAQEASFHVVSCPRKTPAWWGAQGSLQPTVSTDLNPASTRLSELGRRSFPSRAVR
ncbi:mitochondrial import inner membrane translocase subunit Tim10 isoform X2 [Odocoileus virginianus]|uniref:Mitochondrial import inner membrane translocase subunit Tim10 isoform X2 n=1 Tax=Odocoileus virginianus TaxID=9874 RepID=A0ABM4IMH0_ODOVR